MGRLPSVWCGGLVFRRRGWVLFVGGRGPPLRSGVAVVCEWGVMGGLLVAARVRRWQGVALVVVVLAALPLVWGSLVASPSVRVDVGAWGDDVVVRGVYGVEQSAGEDYRWTDGRALLVVPNVSARYQVLRLRGHGWRPTGVASPLVRFTVGDVPWGSAQFVPSMRVYAMLLPRDGASREVRVGFASSTYEPPGDARQLGFGLDWVELRAVDGVAGPTLWQFGGQAVLLGVVGVVLWVLVLPSGWVLAVLVGVSGALVWANVREPLWVSEVVWVWVVLVAVMVVATWAAAGRVERALSPWMSAQQGRVVWALGVAAVVVRVAGAVHPLFHAHDVDVHMRWLEIVGGGQLYLYSTPSEFRNQQTFNPPAGYVALLPLWLVVPSSRLVVQVGVALFDAFGCLLVVPIARRLRLSAAAGVWALALALALPIGMTMLWWGFATNALAQTFWLLLLWALLRAVDVPDGHSLLFVAVFCGACLLTHVGALVITLAMVGVSVVLGWRWLSSASRWVVVGGVALAVGMCALLYVAAVIGPVLGGASSAGGMALGALLAQGWAERGVRLALVSRGFQVGFLVPMLVLAPLGVVQMVRGGRHGFHRAIVVAWVVVCVGFLVAYLGLGLVVRYIYFVAPLVCLAVGVFLARLGRRRAGRLVALGVTLLVVWMGTALWVAGVLARVKPSAVPLTH